MNYNISFQGEGGDIGHQLRHPRQATGPTPNNFPAVHESLPPYKISDIFLFRIKFSLRLKPCTYKTKLAFYHSDLCQLDFEVNIIGVVRETQSPFAFPLRVVPSHHPSLKTE